MAMAYRSANRRCIFAVASISTLAAKLVHIQTHISSLPTIHLVRWGYTFFAQDMALLLLVRLLLDTKPPFWARKVFRTGATILATFLMFYLILLGAITVSFFAVAGSEIHWRNIGLAADASSWVLFLSGLATLLLVTFIFFVTGLVLQDLLYITAGFGTDIVQWPIGYLCRKLLSLSSSSSRNGKYSKMTQQDPELETKYGAREQRFTVLEMPPMLVPILRQLCYALVGTAILAQIVLSIIRPNESALNFMSWTPAVLPFVDFSNSSPNLDKLMPVLGSGIGRTWDHRSALHHPVSFPWLPQDKALRGFEDWFDRKPHYDAAADPLKISNMDEKVLSGLQNKLKDVPIRHVMLIILESTRKDVFPIKKDGLIWDRFSSSFNNKSLPTHMQDRLSTLTPTANFLTGDYYDGFEHKTKPRRGGISFKNAFTTASYTIKSIVGTLCGLSPLVADFNLEYLHHIYQPCLPHIFDVFNKLNRSESDREFFTTFKWRSWFMQSVTRKYDKYEPLMDAMGYQPGSLISKEYLQDDAAKFGKVDLPNINYFGMSEEAVDVYIRDAFAMAQSTNERVFMTHLTSTSHHPYAMPAGETYVPLGNGLDDLSHYVNAIGYDDRWLGRILHILETEGVANETLVVLVGDHGVSIPENGILAPYYNPNIGTVHIPLVLSHPKLPAIELDDAVMSSQILPTILDLLDQTGSLSLEQSQAAHDLAANYEGQSLIRPLKTFSNETGQANWQFTVINPGRAMLGVRDARHPNWRLVVPIIDNVEWKFTNIELDPREAHPVLGFDFTSFLPRVEKSYGIDAAKWAEEAAFMARWWVEENGKRWRYGPYTG